MLYHKPGHVTHPASECVRLPTSKLIGFQRVTLAQNTTAELQFTVDATPLGLVDSDGSTVLYSGKRSLIISGRTVELEVIVNVDLPVPVTVSALSH